MNAGKKAPARWSIWRATNGREKKSGVQLTLSFILYQANPLYNLWGQPHMKLKNIMLKIKWVANDVTTLNLYFFSDYQATWSTSSDPSYGATPKKPINLYTWEEEVDHATIDPLASCPYVWEEGAWGYWKWALYCRGKYDFSRTNVICFYVVFF